MKYYTELDGIRGFAALTIFFFHFLHGQTFSGLLPGVFMKLVSIGPTMANLFFVLSGFLITQILLNAKGTHNYFSYYYARRILRIFPLYYLVLLIYFFGLPILYGRAIPSFCCNGIIGCICKTCRSRSGGHMRGQNTCGRWR